jgi:hypothetical protein
MIVIEMTLSVYFIIIYFIIDCKDTILFNKAGKQQATSNRQQADKPRRAKG